MQQEPKAILALDVGEQRVGVALANSEVRLAAPHATLRRTAHFWDELATILETESVGEVVVGLPRGLAGQDTAQTRSVRQFGEQLKHRYHLPVHFQDEALTSVRAEAELRQKSRPRPQITVDSLAATYILEDYLGALSRSKS